MSVAFALPLAVVLLAANAFFVAAEFALVSARRSAVQARAEQGSRSALSALRAMERVSLTMAAAQLGITLSSLALGALAEPAVASLVEPAFAFAGVPGHLVHPVSFAVALALVVFAHVVFGEMVPKNLALAAPDSTAMALARPMGAVAVLLSPAVRALNLVANGALRLANVTPRDEVTSAFTRDEVASLVAQSRREGLLAEDEAELVSSALALDESPVSRVALPIGDLVSVSPADSLEDVEKAAGMSGFSRILVKGALGELAGYVHVKDLLAADGTGTALSISRPLATVAADQGLRAALEEMRRSGAHLAVVSRYGDPVGVVAFEDILEELVGEIRDSTHG